VQSVYDNPARLVEIQAEEKHNWCIPFVNWCIWSFFFKNSSRLSYRRGLILWSCSQQSGRNIFYVHRCYEAFGSSFNMDKNASILKNIWNLVWCFHSWQKQRSGSVKVDCSMVGG